MNNIAIIGVGTMGEPMALNLLAAGHEVRAFNRTFERTAKIASHGGQAARSIEAAVRDTHFIITMLPDSADVKQVMTGVDGVFSMAPEGAQIIDMSTIDPSVARALARQGSELGFSLLDAPVSGGERGAIAGELSIMVGGDKDAFEAARPILDIVGNTVVHVGPAGTGQLVKAANQLLVAGMIALVSESLVFLDAHRVELAAAVEVLAGGLAANAILEHKAAGMLSGDFRPGFRAELHHKDLRIALQAARSANIVLPVGAIVSQLLTSLQAKGGGELDHTALLQVVAELSGHAGLSTTTGYVQQDA